MTQVVEGVFTIVKSLKQKERKQLVDAMLKSGLLSEDQQDVITLLSRRNGKRRPLAEFVEEMKSKGRIR